MKNLIYYFLAIVLLTSCAQQEQRYFADSDEINTLKSGIDAYESGNWEAWKSNFADTAKIYVNSKEGMSVADRLVNLKGTAGAFSEYGFDRENEYIEMVLDKEDETWVYYWAQHNGKLAGNNKELSFPVHLAVRFIDGKIVAEHIYFDGTEMNNEMAAIASMSDMDKAVNEGMSNIHQAWINNNTEILNSYLDENITRSVNGVTEVEGRANYLAMVQANHDMLSNVDIVLSDIAINDNVAQFKWTFSGKHDKDTDDLKATNKDISVNGMAMWTFDSEGKATHEAVYFNPTEMNLQMGFTLQPPSE